MLQSILKSSESERQISGDQEIIFSELYDIEQDYNNISAISELTLLETFNIEKNRFQIKSE